MEIRKSREEIWSNGEGKKIERFATNIFLDKVATSAAVSSILNSWSWAKSQETSTMALTRSYTDKNHEAFGDLWNDLVID